MNGTLQACQLVNQMADQATAIFSLPHSNGDNSKTALEVSLPVECSFLAGLAQRKLEDWPGAQAALELAAQTSASPSAPLASNARRRLPGPG